MCGSDCVRTVTVTGTSYKVEGQSSNAHASAGAGGQFAADVHGSQATQQRTCGFRTSKGEVNMRAGTLSASVWAVVPRHRPIATANVGEAIFRGRGMYVGEGALNAKQRTPPQGHRHPSTSLNFAALLMARRPKRHPPALEIVD